MQFLGGPACTLQLLDQAAEKAIRVKLWNVQDDEADRTGLSLRKRRVVNWP